ncbi:MAG: UDP-N-acetylglucosamine 2-epimerase (non-hydrolyzing) [Ignavibacteriaceae bacterium]
MKKILIIFGTRPEAIKLAPVIKALKRERNIQTVVCSTGQHDEMLQQVVGLFKIKIDFNLHLMKPNQDLFGITAGSVEKLKTVLNNVKPDLLIVQGDTTTAFTSALSAFYSKVKVVHVEAGLRSNNIFSPYPEEVNRRIISILTDINFAPTVGAKYNLIAEGIPAKKIIVTGNTVIDSLLEIKHKLKEKSVKRKIEISLNKLVPDNLFDKEFILITIHRREKFGETLQNILNQFKEIAEENKKYNFIYPVHLNPNVKKPVRKTLTDISNFKLLPPLDYLSFIYLMSKCRFIISDSGGIQEECYIFRKPIIVLRDNTEREEAIKAGYAFLTGGGNKDFKKVFYQVDKKLSQKFNFFKGSNPFGNGRASERIVKSIKKYLR